MTSLMNDLGLTLHAKDPREPCQVRETLLGAPRKRNEHLDAPLCESLEIALRVLLLVREDEVRLERRDVLDARVLRPADARHPRDDVHGQIAVVRAADERIPQTERRHAVGVARHEADDAAGPAHEREDASPVVGDADRPRVGRGVRRRGARVVGFGQASHSYSSSEGGDGGGGPPST
jgi:hypothetical protein